MVHLEDINQLKLTIRFMPVLICASKKRIEAELKIENQIITINATHGQRPNDLINDLNMTRLEYILGNQNLIPFMAFQLYDKPYYSLMRDAFGERFFIQSAGFGIVRSNLKLPYYNITFNGNEKKSKRFYNKGENEYFDLNQILDTGINNEDIVFLGSRNYLEQFIKLTSRMPNRKIIFYYGNLNINQFQNLDNSFVFVQYKPINSQNKRTWHYELANKLAEAEILQK